MYPYYIKKEDAKDILKGQKRQMSIVVFGLGMVVELMAYIVMPKLTNLYVDMGVEIPVITQMLTKYSAYFTVVMGLLAIYLSSPNFLDREFEDKLTGYKVGEQIKTSELLNKSLTPVMMVLIGLCIGFLVVAIILPIYNLTAAIN